MNPRVDPTSFTGNEVPLYPGTIRGYRHFSVEDNYKLTSPIMIWRHIFTSEGNEAQCCLHFSEAHRVAGTDCSCGFYAYFFPADSAYTNLAGLVPAIVEGYGTVTYGTKGFRSERLNVIAVTLPKKSKNPLSRIEDLITRRWRIALTMAPMILGCALAEITTTRSDKLGILFACLTFLTPLLASRWLSLGSSLKVSYSEAKFKERYPEVQIFGSESAMFRAFPVTGPPRNDEIAQDATQQRRLR